jgi:hypothetical protein
MNSVVFISLDHGIRKSGMQNAAMSTWKMITISNRNVEACYSDINNTL